MFLKIQIALTLFFAIVLWKNKKIGKEHRKEVITLIFALSLISGFIVELIPLPVTTVQLIALDEKNPLSQGTQIALKGTTVAGEDTGISSSNTWIPYDTDFYGWVPEEDSRYIDGLFEETELEIPIGLHRTLIFLTHNFSGLVQVESAGHTEVLDLYSENIGELVFTIEDTDTSTLYFTKGIRLILWAVLTLCTFHATLRIYRKHTQRFLDIRHNEETMRRVLLFGIWVCYVLIQYSVISNIEWPLNHFDEARHIQIAYSLISGDPIASIHYPILYPLMISPAFLFLDSFAMIQIIDILIASTTIPISYFGLKGLVPDSCRIPSTLLFLTTTFATMAPVYQLAELQMLPLLLSTVFYHLHFGGKKSCWYAVGAGILCLCLFYTKYLALVFLPIFGLCWISCYYDEKNIKNSLILLGKHFIAYGTTFVTLILAYTLFYSQRNGVSFDLNLIKTLMGFSTSYSESVSTSVSMPEFKWVLKYTSHVLLMSIPVIYMILSHFDEIVEDQGLVKKTFLIYLGIAIVTIFVAARHSSLVTYNAGGVMNRLLGRYVSYSLPIGLILSILLHHSNDNIHIKTRIKALFYTIIVLCFSYYWLYEPPQWNVNLGIFNNRDIYAFSKFGEDFILYVMLLLLIFSYCCQKKRNAIYLVLPFSLMLLPHGLVNMEYFKNSYTNTTERARQVFQYYYSKTFEPGILFSEEATEIYYNFNGTTAIRATLGQDLTYIGSELILDKNESEKDSYYYHSTSEISKYSHYNVYNLEQNNIYAEMIKITPTMTQRIFQNLQETSNIQSNIEITNDYTIKGWAYLEEDTEEQTIALLITTEDGEQYIVFENEKIENDQIDTGLDFTDIGFDVSVRYTCSLKNAQVQAVILTEDGYFVSSDVVSS